MACMFIGSDFPGDNFQVVCNAEQTDQTVCFQLQFMDLYKQVSL